MSPALGRVSSVVVFRFQVYEMACSTGPRVRVRVGGKPITARIERSGEQKTVHLEQLLPLKEGDKLEIAIVG